MSESKPIVFKDCAWCWCTYDYSKSTASDHHSKLLFCSLECEAADTAYLVAGNKIIEEAKAQNPELFCEAIKPKQEHVQNMNKLMSLLNMGNKED